MSAKSRGTEAEQITSAGILVDNSLSIEEIKALVALKGYDETELQSGRSKIVFALQSLKDQARQEGIARDATKAEASSKLAAHTAYQDLAQILRGKYLANSPELVKVGLVGSEPATIADFLKAGYTLFDNAAADADISAYILLRGYTPEIMHSERNKFSVYEKANEDQVTAMGLASDATKAKIKAFIDMNTWISEYKASAKVALRKKPALLEQLGIKIRKRGPNKKKNKKNNNKPPETPPPAAQ